MTILDYAPTPPVAPVAESLARQPVGVLPDEFTAPAVDGTGQYEMRAELLLPADFLLVGSCMWMRVVSVTPTGFGDRLAVAGRRATGHAMTIHVGAVRCVRVWHPADIMIDAVLGEAAGCAR